MDKDAHISNIYWEMFIPDMLHLMWYSVYQSYSL